MTTPTELGPLLLAIGLDDIELAPHPTDPTRLRHRPGVIPADLAARLHAHRAAVLDLLVNGYTLEGDDASYVFAERLGIADGLGLATHRGSAAWLVAVGESLAQCCGNTTTGIYSPNGPTNGCDYQGSESERRIALRDRQGCGNST